MLEKALSDYAGDPSLLLDVLRARAVAGDGTGMLGLLEVLKKGATLKVEQGTVTLTLMRAKNKCSPKMLDPTRFRNVLCNLRLEFDGHACIVELQVHHDMIQQDSTGKQIGPLNRRSIVARVRSVAES